MSIPCPTGKGTIAVTWRLGDPSTAVSVAATGPRLVQAPYQSGSTFVVGYVARDFAGNDGSVFGPVVVP